MDVAIFLKNNCDKNYDEIKTLFEKKYNIKVNIDQNKNYYMLLNTNKSNIRKKIVRQCSGIIIDTKTNNILYYFGEKSYQNNFITESYLLDNFLVGPYINGIIIKIFRHNNKWKMATSKHTNIKNFKVNNIILYDIFKKTVTDLFDSMQLFFKYLDSNYCYTYLLYSSNYKNNIKLINKVNLKTLKIDFNIKDYIPLINFSNTENNNDIKKYILLKIEENGIKRIHIDKEILHSFIFTRLKYFVQFSSVPYLSPSSSSSTCYTFNSETNTSNPEICDKKMAVKK